MYIYINSHAEELKKKIMDDITIIETEEYIKNLMSGDKKKSRERRENKTDILFMEEDKYKSNKKCQRV